jgi:hypothetical protein
MPTPMVSSDCSCQYLQLLHLHIWGYLLKGVFSGQPLVGQATTGDVKHTQATGRDNLAVHR